MKLYVGNLPAAISDTDLEEIFAPFGAVISARVAKTRYSGRSRGFGFVEMLQDCGRRAISELDGQQIECTVLCVNEAKEI